MYCVPKSYWTKPRIAAAVVLILFAIPLFLHLLCGLTLFINHTASAPRGVYLSVPGQLCTGDYAIVQCPEAVEEINIPQGFLLLKKAAAFPGDAYTVSNGTLTVSGRTYPIASLPYLPILPSGTRTVPNGMILFLNDPDDSLDSRYFGPIPTENIVTKAILLINYDELPFLSDKRE